MGNLTDRLTALLTEAQGRSVSAPPVRRLGQASARLMQTPWRPPAVYLPNERPTPRLGDILRRVAAQLRRAHGPYARVSRAWAAAAPELASHTDVANWREGALEIAVDSAPLLSELRSFRLPALLRALQSTPDGLDVASISFTLRRRSGVAPGVSPGGPGAAHTLSPAERSSASRRTRRRAEV